MKPSGQPNFFFKKEFNGLDKIYIYIYKEIIKMNELHLHTNGIILISRVEKWDVKIGGFPGQTICCDPHF